MLPFVAACALLLALIALYVRTEPKADATRLPADSAKETNPC